MKPVYDKWVPKIGKELVDQAEKEMAATDKK